VRVVHIVTAFPRHDGDVITPWLGRVLLRLREEGVDASVLAPSYRGGGSAEWRGVPVHRFRYAPSHFETLTHDETVPDRLRNSPYYAALLPSYMLGGLIAAINIARVRPDVLHVHWPVPNAFFGSVGKMAMSGDAALVSSYYSVELKWLEHRLPWLLPCLRWSIECADEVTAISTATAALVRSYTNRPVRIIPFAAGVDTAQPGSEAGKLVTTSLVPEKDVLFGEGKLDTSAEVLFVGRLVERKGVEVLIRAISKLREQRDVRLTIVGEGPWAPHIRETILAEGIEDAVFMAGKVETNDLPHIYGKASVFVLPAVIDAKGDTEGLGVVLIEAIRAGVPVIGSNIGGIPDIVVHGETGWLVPSGHVEALANAIEEVLTSPSEALRRVRKGRERIDERFSLAGVVAALTDCYESALTKVRSPR